VVLRPDDLQHADPELVVEDGAAEIRVASNNCPGTLRRACGEGDDTLTDAQRMAAYSS